MKTTKIMRLIKKCLIKGLEIMGNNQLQIWNK